MAIYHFSGTVISRGQGRSAVACAAYRSGEKMLDERQERYMDYGRKQGVFFKEILLPTGAPEWMANREKLWNAVEKAENRKDAQLAREFNFSLPRELSHEQNIKLAKEFVQNQFIARGMVADVCLHGSKGCDGEEQPHAHVMLTMREVGQDGFGLKERAWNGKENLLVWREAWAEHLNHYLAINGIDFKVDHRSLAEQGINMKPQSMDKVPNSSDYRRQMEEYEKVVRANGEKLLAEPSLVLNVITKHQATFTYEDILRFVNRHTADITQFQGVVEKVKGLGEMVTLGKDQGGVERFTTKEMLALEKQMLGDVGVLANKGHGLKEQGTELGISGLERENIKLEQEVNSITHGFTLSHQQWDALWHITEGGDIKCLVGYAGTGKSHILNQARELWEKSGYRLSGITLSGIAAENLEGASGITSRTLASRCYYWDRGKEQLTAKDIVVIDEAGMLGTRQLARTIAEVKAHGAKLVLIGDPQQLQAIEAGAAFRAIATKTSYLELTEVRRQLEPWQQAATKEFAMRDIGSALGRYKQHSHVHECENQVWAKQVMVQMWNDVRNSDPEKAQIMLAYTRRDAAELNSIARDYKRQDNELGEDVTLATSTGNKPFAVGDRIYFLRNNRDLGVMNGTLGNIMAIEGTKLSILVDRDRFKGNKVDPYRQVVNFAMHEYNYITHGYAATIHKAQGVTVDRSYVLATQHLDSHSTYVGMSRHRESVELFWSKEEFRDEEKLIQTLSRDRSKDIALDYMQDPAQEDLRENLALEDSAESKLRRLVNECSKYISAIDYCNAKQEEFKQGGNFSPYIQQIYAENREKLINSLKENCGRDIDMLNYLKTKEPQLFTEINRVCSNILTNTIKTLESNELLTKLTQGQPGLYEKVLLAEKDYKELSNKYTKSIEEVTKVFKVTGDIEALPGLRAARDATKEEFEQYANNLSTNVEIVRIIEQHNQKLFKEMNTKFDNLFIEAIKKDDLQQEYARTHSDNYLSKEERVIQEYEHYLELKKECTQARESVMHVYTVTGDLDELKECRENRDMAENTLENYANEICHDKDFMDYLAKNDAREFKEMNERFNEIMREQMHEMQQELMRDI